MRCHLEKIVVSRILMKNNILETAIFLISSSFQTLRMMSCCLKFNALNVYLKYLEARMIAASYTLIMKISIPNKGEKIKEQLTADDFGIRSKCRTTV